MLKRVFILLTILYIPSFADATAQIPDIIIFRGEKYDLIGLAGGQLFKPQNFGMEPVPLHTACWRGFYSTYVIKDKLLFLQKMTTSIKNGNYKPINKILPQLVNNRHEYQNVNLLVPFTGKLRIAKDFIRDYYIHMGFQKASAYKIVIDLSFEDGKLENINDRSFEVERMRGEFKKRYEAGGIKQKIGEAFSLDLELY